MTDSADPQTASREHRSTLEVSPDGLKVLYSGPVPASANDPILERLSAELCDLGVSNPPSREEMATLIAGTAAGGFVVKDLPLLEGRPPTPPQDGAIEWETDFFRQGYCEDEKTGAVDFRQHAAHLSVAEGQLLARLLPPREGEAGVNVFGKQVPVARARAFRVRAGPNVRWEEAEACFYAAANGRIRWNGDTLAVDPVFEVPGSVGMATGNIVHPGALVVRQDIESGSAVKAAGDVEVKGLVEAADVDCGGSLVIFGGLTGGDGHWVRAAGSVHARFVRDAEVEAGGDIVIEKESVQSVLKTGGSLLMPRGRIVGGEAIALRTIEVRDAGSPAGIQTMLVVGEHFARAGEIRGLQLRVSSLETSLSRIRRALEESGLRQDKLSSAQIHALKALEIKAQEAEEELVDLRGRLRSACGGAEQSRPRIVIHGYLYPETVLRIGNERFGVTDAIRGPLTALVSGGSLILAPGEIAPKG